MKRLRHLAPSLLLALSLAATAFAAEVPESLVVENLNGQQRIVKTYVLSPETDPEVLKEPSFDYDGFHYTWAYTTKEEHTFLETKDVTEAMTVETAKKDLNTILEQLAPSIPYDDGEFSGELVLDHTSLSTEAAGYTTRSGRVTATKTIGPVDRNDMSYVPATTVKDGRTLSLANVEWQVVGTDLAGDSLVPTSYQAVATYSASTSYQVATGYVTTAEYKGTVTASGVDGVTYTVVYTGTEIPPAAVESLDSSRAPGGAKVGAGAAVPALLGLLVAAMFVGAGAWLFLRRSNVCVYIPGDRPRDYKLVAKYRTEPQRPEIDISGLTPYPEGIVAVEVKRPLAKNLMGQSFTVHHRGGSHTYTILQNQRGDWHEFDLNEEETEQI